MQLSELRPFAKKVDVIVKVLGKNEVREVTSKLDNSTHKVTEANVGDASGIILLTLWDDTIDKVEEGKSYKITNGYTSLFQNKLRLNIGRYGTLEESAEEVTEVNETNNLSEKEFESRPRFGGGGGRFGGRGGGGGRFGGRGGGYGNRGSYGGGRGGGYGRRSEGQDSESGDFNSESSEGSSEEGY